MGKQSKSISPYDIEIARRLRMRRRMIGVSQEELGNALGLTFQQVQKYENATNRIGSGRLQQIAGILKCPMSYFFDEVANADGAPAASAFFQVHGSVEIAQAFSKIKDGKQRSALLALVQLMARSK